MAKKILITGGTGFIGYHLAKKCLDLGWQVTSVSTRRPIKMRKLKKVKYLICDISNQKDLYKKISLKYNYIVNLAGYVDHSNKRKTILSHYNGCKNLALRFAKSNLEKFIQIGSSIEYGKIKSPQKENIINNQKMKTAYGMAKLLSTKFLLKLYNKNNFPVTILRLYLVYGPKQDINRVIPITIHNSLNNKNFDCSSGIQLRDFTFIDDVIEAIIKAIKNKKVLGKILNIGSGKPVKICKVILKICSILKSGNPQFGKIKFRKDEIISLYPSITEAKKLLKWKPKIRLDQGLKKTISFFKKKNEK